MPSVLLCGEFPTLSSGTDPKSTCHLELDPQAVLDRIMSAAVPVGENRLDPIVFDSQHSCPFGPRQRQ
eukprot:CAMPEP_0177583630 /NCGR_PEP_ID=MMETSP0419_2-20121207/3427_1 /TAXON_ID=582737 /ORGANISM="Tetraselmis sp., Strain GSL018" /LENGTH=67 /DNA_ID=CAMNT_0019073039 /DNA_START=831 /DNA_END=1031 /DNA_ORIENTATION=-